MNSSFFEKKMSVLRNLRIFFKTKYVRSCAFKLPPPGSKKNLWIRIKFTPPKEKSTFKLSNKHNTFLENEENIGFMLTPVLRNIGCSLDENNGRSAAQSVQQKKIKTNFQAGKKTTVLCKTNSTILKEGPTDREVGPVRVCSFSQPDRKGVIERRRPQKQRCWSTARSD